MIKNCVKLLYLNTIMSPVTFQFVSDVVVFAAG